MNRPVAGIGLGRLLPGGEPCPALLLLGPTGSGKTPLGDHLERSGFAGHRCHHFDFGANLRHIGGMVHPPVPLTEQDAAVIRHSLATGALLENRDFPIVLGILSVFAAERGLRRGDLLILNGMPRHAGQAERLEACVDVRMVLSLECSSDVVMARIESDSGGDRNGRVDDSREDVVRKLNLFRERTMPLLDHYRAKGVRIVPLCVEVATQPSHLAGKIPPDPLEGPSEREGTH